MGELIAIGGPKHRKRLSGASNKPKKMIKGRCNNTGI